MLKKYKGQEIRVLLQSGFKAEGKVVTKKGILGLNTKGIFYYETAISKILE